MFKRLLIAVTAPIFLSSGGPASAVDVYKTGRIATASAFGSNNYSFRVTFTDGLATCNNDMAFLNDSDGNYAVYVTLLTTAALSGRTVDIMAVKDGSGFCKINYVILNS